MAYATSSRPYTVEALREFVIEGRRELYPVCSTRCKTLEGALRSAKSFAPEFTSLVIRFGGEVVKVVR